MLATAWTCIDITQSKQLASRSALRQKCHNSSSTKHLLLSAGKDLTDQRDCLLWIQELIQSMLVFFIFFGFIRMDTCLDSGVFSRSRDGNLNTHTHSKYEIKERRINEKHYNWVVCASVGLDTCTFMLLTTLSGRSWTSHDVSNM